MKEYSLENIRNITLLGHSGSGKTSLGEAILYTGGVTNRLGSVEAGNTASDYEPEEIKRKISTNLSLLPLEWGGVKLNMLDAPGYSDFLGEVVAALRVTESAIIIVSAISGVEIGTEQAWEYTEGRPRMIFVNKMDRENANFGKVVEELRKKFGRVCRPLDLPIGSFSDLKGMIDLLDMKAYLDTGEEAAIPEDMIESARSWREELVEAIAENNDDLLEAYLEGKEIAKEELSRGLAVAIKEGKVVPVLAGSAVKQVGIRQILDFISQYLPSAKESEIVLVGDSGKMVLTPEETSDLQALVFKTTADPYVGKLTYFRVYSGVIESNSQMWNVSRGEMERVGQLYLVRGKTQEPVPRVTAGDIGAVAKLNVTATGDTLSNKAQGSKLEPIKFPEPLLSVAIYPRTKADLDKMGSALARACEEDPTLRLRRDSDTGDTLLSGLGETQLEVVAEKMNRKFGVSVELKPPKVPYRETITRPAKAEYKHKKQTGGHGQYGHVLIEIEPLPRESGLEFVDKVFGGAIPKNYIPAVEKGIYEAAREGVVAGYPVTDIRVSLYDGSYHPVDSSEICFKIAAAQALKKGLSDGQPILLEPVMSLEVTAPEELTGDIIADLNTKRARVQGMVPHDGVNEIKALVPMSEVLRYAIDLKSLTQGRSSFTLTFSHYEPVPPNITQKVASERQAEKGKETKE
jgi:elongation factor G